jgi:ribosomal protein S18 acetylase RimI-like enzyme
LGGFVTFVELGPADADRLAAFTCGGQPWSDIAQEMIRNDLPIALGTDPTVNAIGLCDQSGHLLAVGAWKVRALIPDPWSVIVLGVDVNHRQKGHAKAIKTEIMRRAKEAGITRLSSHVDRNNEPMIELNKKLHGRYVWDPKDDSEDVLFLVPVV